MAVRRKAHRAVALHAPPASYDDDRRSRVQMQTLWPVRQSAQAADINKIQDDGEKEIPRKDVH